MILRYILHAPWWVYPILGYLLYTGIKALKPHHISLPKMFLGPSAVNLLNIFNNTVPTTYNLSYKVIIWITAWLIGAFMGWICFRNTPLEIDKKKLLFTSPGTYTTLLLWLAIFGLRYFWGVMEAVHPQPWQAHLVYIRAASLSLLSGFAMGKSFRFLYRFIKSN